MVESSNAGPNSSSPKMTIRDRVSDFTSRLGIFGELLRFLWARKMWWLIPMILALVAFGILIVLGSSGVLSPFIYSLF
jgi:Family of unknown function (DUF5989)